LNICLIRNSAGFDENCETCCILVANKHFEYLTDMETIITIHIEKLPEGVYLATSDTLQGLVAQGRTISETLEIARDVAKMLLEAGL
jgi:predicted RNase H-like HicB family nuclease